MSAIGKGDWVECVRVDAPREGEASLGFRVGALYFVEALDNNDVNCPWCGRCGGLHIAGKPPARFGYSACGFRPIYRPNADFIESLKRPAPADKEVA